MNTTINNKDKDLSKLRKQLEKMSYKELQDYGEKLENKQRLLYYQMKTEKLVFEQVAKERNIKL